MKKLVLALIVVALGLIAAPAAQSASSKDCLGKVPNVLGTSKTDVIVVYVDEGGPSGTVNGRDVRDEDASWAVIYSKDGDDKIIFQGDRATIQRSTSDFVIRPIRTLPQRGRMWDRIDTMSRA